MVIMKADDVCQIARELAPPLLERPTFAGDVANKTILVVQGQVIPSNPNQP